MGPVYIKLGQLLSTRRDLIPEDVADALALLQDQVPPEPAFDIHTFLQQHLSQPVNTAFDSVEPEAFASASIAQIHGAKLPDQTEVVIKLVRPGIRDRIKQDMVLLHTLARRVTQLIPATKRLQLVQVCLDHEQVLLQELDMRHEAQNQIQLRRNFADSPLLYVPRVYSEFTGESVLVMERVFHPSINALDTFAEAGVDMKVLAHKGVETFFKQVFEHNFFHADMHPGNIQVDISNPADPRYVALDCAIIGSLTPEDQSYLAQNLLAFFNRDYRQVVELHIDSGWVPAATDPDDFESVIKEVCEPIFAKPLAEISFGEFVLTLFQTAARFNMEIQPQLVLLQKTLLYIEGLGRQLYPELDLWETAAPFMETWAAERLGPGAVLSNWLQGGPQFWQHLAELPANNRRLKSDMTRLQASLETQATQLEAIQKKQRYQRTGLWALALATLALWWW